MKAWQLYLDNCASYGVIKREVAEKLEGKVFDWHRQARAAWEAYDTPSAADKSVANAYEAKELGAKIEGKDATLATTVQRRLGGLALSIYISAVVRPHRMWLAVDAGN